MIYIGIDPGLKGGIAKIITDGLRVDIRLQKMPIIKIKKTKSEIDGKALVQLLRNVVYENEHPVFCVIEKAQAMVRRDKKTGKQRGQGTASAFTFGAGFGFIKGVVAALEISHTIVHPRTWQSVMLRDVGGDDTKAKALIVAQRLFPNVDLRGSERSCKPHDGIVDALLLAEYARRIHGHNELE